MEPSPELRALIRSWFDALAAGDATWAARHVSRAAAARLIGPDPAEWLQGPEVAQYLSNQANALDGATVMHGHIEAFVEGSVGWGVAGPTLDVGGTELCPRWSGVFHHEDGAWKLVQCHSSMGVSTIPAGLAVFRRSMGSPGHR